jgi:hypothetical protein
MERTKDLLFEIGDVAIFYQYLYLDPTHNIVVNNGLTDLKFELNDNLHIMKTNLNYPEFGASNEPLDLTNILGIIDKLKTMPAVQHPACFQNRWQEIKEITASTLALNHFLGKNR